MSFLPYIGGSKKVSFFFPFLLPMDITVLLHPDPSFLYMSYSDQSM